MCECLRAECMHLYGQMCLNMCVVFYVVEVPSLNDVCVCAF